MALSDLPPASVTVAVMMCVPDWSVLMLRLAPVPRAPSRLELHAMAVLRSPCSGSVAVPVRTTVVAGAEDAVGGGRGDRDAGAPLTTIATVALSVLPPASVTVAVMVCVPDWSVLTLRRRRCRGRRRGRAPVMAAPGRPARGRWRCR